MTTTKPLPTPPAADAPVININLRFSLLDNGIGSPVAVLLHEALQEYSAGLLENGLLAFRDGDDESAAVFLSEHEDVSQLMRILLGEVVKASNQNEEYSKKLLGQTVISKERNLAGAIDEFKKKYRKL